MKEKIFLDGKKLNIEKIYKVAVGAAKVEFSRDAINRIRKSRKIIEENVRTGKTMYGVTTGIGEFAKVKVSPEQSAELQKRIILSHSSAFGNPFRKEFVRAAMAVRANVLGMGYSAVRFEVANTLVEMLNRDVVPYVREKGSLGASGDLAPLAEISSVIIGHGKAWYKGRLMSGKKAMQMAKIPIVELSYKEGLALINGPHVMAGCACHQLYESFDLVKNAIIAYSMTLDALMAIQKPFLEKVHKARPFPGQMAVAANIRKMLKGSEILKHKTGRVQDAYSLRCIPQILGPTIDMLHFATKQIEIEINSASDNPLVFLEDGSLVEAGNFHGQGTGLVMDYSGIALSEIANLAERHVNRLLNPDLSGLPDFLVEGKGLNSGFMIAQYTAAAMVSENKVLSHPASVDSIPVSADQEDHVSMGPIAVRKFEEIKKNVRAVIGIQMLCASQALDFRKPLEPGVGTNAAYKCLREHVKYLKNDRELNRDFEKVYELVENNDIIRAVEAKIGTIRI